MAVSKVVRVPIETYERLEKMGGKPVENIKGLLDMWDNLQAGKTIQVERILFSIPTPASEPVPYAEEAPNRKE